MALMALAGGLAKGIATKSLVKKPKISAAKFAGKAEEAKKSATPKGAIIPSPGGSIVKVVDVKPDPEKKVQGDSGDPLIREVSIIYKRTIDIQKALRNEQKNKRTRAKKKLKVNEKNKRSLRESLMEGAGKTAKGIASRAMSPVSGLFDKLLQGISMIFFGWLSNHLPKILGFVESMVGAVSTIGKFLTPILRPIFDAVKWITVEGVKLIAKITGTPSDEADNKTLLGNIAEIQKKIPLIEAAFAAFIISDVVGMVMQAGEFIKDHKKTIQRVLRKTYRKLPKPARNFIRQTSKALKPKNLLKTVKNIKLPKAPGGGWLSGIRSNIGKGWQATKGAVVKAGKGAWGLSKQALKAANEYAVKQLDNLGTMWKGAKEWGAKQAKKLGDIAELAKNPKKLAELMKNKLTKQINKIVKNNKTLKNLLAMVKDPTKIGSGLKGLLEGAKKSQGILDVKAALNRAKSAKVGGVDKVIAAIMALIDYMALKESPVNAIVKALSGMLGYAAGFAIGAPFGGMPGFLTGMVGGALGELAGYGLLKVTAKALPGLTKMDDPIMNDGRPVLRDPDGPMDHMIDKNLKITKDNSSDKNNDATKISESASYDQSNDTSGTGSIIPVPVDQMKGGGSSGGSTTISTGTALNKHEVASTNQKTKELANLYKD